MDLNRIYVLSIGALFWVLLLIMFFCFVINIIHTITLYIFSLFFSQVFALPLFFQKNKRRRFFHPLLLCKISSDSASEDRFSLKFYREIMTFPFSSSGRSTSSIEMLSTKFT